MHFKQLTTEIEFKIFQEKFKKYGAIDLPISYLDKCKVVGLYDNKKLLGGFCLAIGDDIRWTQCLANKCDFLEKTSKDKMIEINGVWIHPSLRKSPLSLTLWSKLAYEVLSAGKKHVTFGAPTFKPKIIKFYKRISSEIIYEGQCKGRDFDAVFFRTNAFKFLFLKILYIKEFIIRNMLNVNINFKLLTGKSSI